MCVSSESNSYHSISAWTKQHSNCSPTAITETHILYWIVNWSSMKHISVDNLFSPLALADFLYMFNVYKRPWRKRKLVFLHIESWCYHMHPYSIQTGVLQTVHIFAKKTVFSPEVLYAFLNLCMCSLKCHKMICYPIFILTFKCSSEFSGVQANHSPNEESQWPTVNHAHKTKQKQTNKQKHYAMLCHILHREWNIN